MHTFKISLVYGLSVLADVITVLVVVVISVLIGSV